MHMHMHTACACACACLWFFDDHARCGIYLLFADEASRQEQPVPPPAAGEATPRPAAAQPLRRDLPFSIAS